MAENSQLADANSSGCLVKSCHYLNLRAPIASIKWSLSSGISQLLSSFVSFASSFSKVNALASFILIIRARKPKRGASQTHSMRANNNAKGLLLSPPIASYWMTRLDDKPVS